MAQVKFIKEYTTKDIPNGIYYIKPRTFKVGEVYEEIQPSPTEKLSGIKIRLHAAGLIGGGPEWEVIPSEYLERVSIAGISASSNTKKIIIGIAIVAAGYFALKYFKIIK